MSTDRSAIEQTIQTYFDGLYEGDADKLGSVFHESSALTWEQGGAVSILSRDAWLKAVRERPSSKAQGLARDVEIDTQQAVIETVRELLVADYDALAFSSDATARNQLVGGLLTAITAKRDPLRQAVVLRTRLWVDAVVEDLVAAAHDDVVQHTTRLARV